jgi:hypothetical protein
VAGYKKRRREQISGDCGYVPSDLRMSACFGFIRDILPSLSDPNVSEKNKLAVNWHIAAQSFSFQL